MRSCIKDVLVLVKQDISEDCSISFSYYLSKGLGYNPLSYSPIYNVRTNTLVNFSKYPIQITGTLLFKNESYYS